MVFTRWGDRNITRKTLGLSVAVHALIGMVSTHVILVTSAPEAGEEPIPIRRLVVENAASKNTAQPTDQQPRPVWDEVASPVAGQVTRSEKFAASPPEPPPERPAYEDAPLPLPLPDAPLPAPENSAAPEVAAVPAARSKPREIAEEPSNEETAQARPEAAPPRPGRLPVRDTSIADASIERSPREQSAQQSPPEPRGTVPSLSAVPPVEVPLPAPVRRAGTEDPSWKKSASGPAEALPEAAVATSSGETDTSPVRRPPRASLENRPAAPAGTIDRQRDDAAAGRRAAARPALPRGDSAERAAPIDAAPMVARQEGAKSPGQGPMKRPAPYTLRGRGLRGQAARDHGATEESERAVRAALDWLARKQHRQGYWPPIEATQGEDPEPLNFGGDAAARAQQALERRASGLAAESGLTALAVLAFLGAGHTHEEGRHAETVDRALRWLIDRQESDGNLGAGANRFARMYCHGMAAIALGEAYGMTKDPALRQPLARATEYVLSMQYPDGSWRYTDWRQLKEAEGDMSMFGWQLMALKSAQTAGLRVPPEGLDKAIDFLAGRRSEMRSRRESLHGGLASYRRGQKPRPAMTAEALYCSQLLGMTRNDPAAVEAVEYLSGQPPRMSAPDLYYWYYGTLAMYHHGGESWRRWNQALQQALLEDQRDDGDYAGSWNPRRPWGDFGGRVFSTAMSTLCLEVYYRYLPLYQTAAGPEAPSRR
jgi:hypothetical protein